MDASIQAPLLLAGGNRRRMRQPTLSCGRWRSGDKDVGRARVAPCLCGLLLPPPRASPHAAQPSLSACVRRGVVQQREPPAAHGAAQRSGKAAKPCAVRA
jgi:hypothetical protein